MVLVDAGYGHDATLRSAITALPRTYVAGIQPQTLVWAQGRRRGLPPKKGRRDAAAAISVKDLARRLPAKAWRTIKWGEGTNAWLTSRFARLRVHVASSHQDCAKPDKEWLLIEWPEGEDEPTKYWLSTVPENIPFRDLVDAAKLRWRIERDYQELKQEVGLGHFEGRGWAWLPPSRHAVHRGLRIPDLRKGDDSPLRTSSRRAVRATCRSPTLSTPRRRRCDPNATSPIRSRPCGAASPTLSSSACHDARAATHPSARLRSGAICDTVVISLRHKFRDLVRLKNPAVLHEAGTLGDPA